MRYLHGVANLLGELCCFPKSCGDLSAQALQHPLLVLTAGWLWEESLGSLTGLALLFLAGPVGSALSARYGARPVVMVGGLLAGLGLLVASFSTTVTHLYLSIGLVTGACLAPPLSPRRRGALLSWVLKQGA